jgi:hypothetical protein
LDTAEDDLKYLVLFFENLPPDSKESIDFFNKKVENFMNYLGGVTERGRTEEL